MEKKILLLLLCIFILVKNGMTQSALVPLNDDYYYLLDRYQISRGKFADSFQYGAKGIARKAVVDFLDTLLEDRTFPLNFVDFYNLDYLRADSWEWSSSKTPDSQKRFLKRFYQKPSDFYNVQNDVVDFHLSPVTDNIVGRAGNDLTWLTTRGVELRGTIGKKIGFYSFVADNQAVFPKYVFDYSNELYSVFAYQAWNLPGETLVKKAFNGKGADFMSARGYVTFSPIKPVTFQFGHDRNFIGNGYRSLFISDFSTPYMFLKITTHIGRLHYTNLLTRLLNNQVGVPIDKVIPKKFGAFHHLSFDITKKLNIGIFEAEIFTRDRGFDLDYVNPVIFYRWVEAYLGSGDNALLGLEMRYDFMKHFSFYSQLLIDEFKTDDYLSKQKSWTKKYGFQAGLKYVNAFGISNLDLQGEYNVVRPFTYSHKSGNSNYVHNNQPIAHPLGANFNEFIGIMHYQPVPRLTFHGTLMLAKKGTDEDGKNWGGNILKGYDSRFQEYNNVIGQGVATTTTYAEMRASYMMRHNFFVDARLMMRKVSSPLASLNNNITMATIGIRLNIPYRQQVF